MISDRFEDFVQSLRVFGERKMGFMKLFVVDAAEAVGNLEHSCAGMLNSFHSLYDAASAHPSVDFDFYGNPLCCFVLCYRNAKHHNQAHGIRSVYRYAQSNPGRESYMLVDFPAAPEEEGGSFVDHFVSWGDFTSLLDLPRDQSRIRNGTSELLRERLGAGRFEAFSEENGISRRRIFINVIPIIMGAGSEVIPHLKKYITVGSVEAEYFVGHFEEVGVADFTDPQYTELESSCFR